MKKILVTGSDGQLGKCLQEEVSHSNLTGFYFTDKERLDISNQQVVEAFFFSNKVDVCINCAAYTDVDKAENDVEKAFQINADGVKYLAKECEENNCLLIQISTDYVFDGNTDVPYKPYDLTNPINIYGKSKLQGEKYALEINPKTIVIRTSWVYSPFGKNFYLTMIRLMSEKKEISVVSDQIGKPTDARDLAKYIVKIINDNDTNYGIRHFSGKEEMSWYQFAQKIKTENQYLTKINPIPTNQYPTAAKRPLWSVLDN